MINIRGKKKKSHMSQSNVLVYQFVLPKNKYQLVYILKYVTTKIYHKIIIIIIISNPAYYLTKTKITNLIKIFKTHFTSRKLRLYSRHALTYQYYYFMMRRIYQY